MGQNVLIPKTNDLHTIQIISKPIQVSHVWLCIPLTEETMLNKDVKFNKCLLQII